MGYAFTAHRATQADPAIEVTTGLLKLRQTLGSGEGYVAFTARDQSADKDESAALGAGFEGSFVHAHNAAVGLDVQVPLTSDASTVALARYFSSLVTQTVDGPALGTSPYFLDDRDAISEESLQIERALTHGSLSAKFNVRSERLDTQIPLSAATDQSSARSTLSFAAPAQTAPLLQTQHSLALRYESDPMSRLHYTFAAYYSSFDRSGTSFDPRAGFVWTPDAHSALRLSAGSTFQAPQLTELYVPSALPPPDANGYIDTGNPNLKADHATEYDAGYEHLFGTAAHGSRVSVDVYRTNLRTPSQRYLPPVTCGQSSPPPAQQSCESYPINIGGAVYRGMELRFDRNLSAQTALHAAYGINSTFAVTVPPQVQNGSLVAGAQFLGVPLHKASIVLDHAVAAGLSYDAGLVYESANNELNRPAFALLNAACTWRTAAFESTLGVTNLSNVYGGGLTILRGGVPYGSADGPIVTDAYSLQGRSVTLSIARKF